MLTKDCYLAVLFMRCSLLLDFCWQTTEHKILPALPCLRIQAEALLTSNSLQQGGILQLLCISPPGGVCEVPIYKLESQHSIALVGTKSAPVLHRSAPFCTVLLGEQLRYLHICTHHCIFTHTHAYTQVY